MNTTPLGPTYEQEMIDAYMGSAIRCVQRGSLASAEVHLLALGQFLERHPDA